MAAVTLADDPLESALLRGTSGPVSAAYSGDSECSVFVSLTLVIVCLETSLFADFYYKKELRHPYVYGYKFPTEW